MKRALILGAAGFLGSQLVKMLALGNEFNILQPDRSLWDLEDQTSLLKLFDELKPQIVINLAALSSTVAKDYDALYAVNAYGQLNVLQALKDTGFTGHMVFVSSSNVYGAAEHGLVSENTRPLPMNHYSCSKLLGENFCSMYQHNFPITIVRPFNCIGPNQKAGLVAIKIADTFIRQERTIELGKLKVARDFVDARDVAQMFLRVMRAKNPPLIANFCNGETCSLIHLLELFSKAAGYELEVKVNPKFIPERDISYQCGDNSVIQSLGYERKFTMRNTVNWIFEERMRMFKS